MGSILEGKNWGDGQQSDEIWKENMHRGNTQCREWCQPARQSRQIQTLVPPPRKKNQKSQANVQNQLCQNSSYQSPTVPKGLLNEGKRQLKNGRKTAVFLLALTPPRYQLSGGLEDSNPDSQCGTLVPVLNGAEQTLFKKKLCLSVLTYPGATWKTGQ